MLNLSPRYQFIIGLVLVLLLALTRSHHFASLHSLPGASWAVFFLAGVYLRPTWVFGLLIGLIVALDLGSIYLFGDGSSFCLSSAYALLLPAYGALWYAGHWYATHYRFAWSTLVPLVGSVLLGATACELVSSGGFYLFSGRFADPSWVEFAVRVVKYYPGYLQSLAFYLGISIVLHVGIVFAHGARHAHTPEAR